MYFLIYHKKLRLFTEDAYVDSAASQISLVINNFFYTRDISFRNRGHFGLSLFCVEDQCEYNHAIYGY